MVIFFSGGDMHTEIVLLILTIAAEIGIPKYFALSIAINENDKLDPIAISKKNDDGSYDFGVMQLSGRYIYEFIGEYWDKDWEFNWQSPYDNIYIGCKHLKKLSTMEKINTWYGVAIAYNAGYSRVNDPPETTIEYAARVMEKYVELSNGKYQVIVPGK